MFWKKKEEKPQVKLDLVLPNDPDYLEALNVFEMDKDFGLRRYSNSRSDQIRKQLHDKEDTNVG